MSQTTSKIPSRIPISSSTWFITRIGRCLGRNIAKEVMQRGGRVDLIGSIELARAAVAHMRPLGGGRLVQVSSGAGQAAFPWTLATKWGIEGLFDSLAQEVAGFGIQTTLVEPGTVRTDFGASGVFSPELDAYREGPVGMLPKMATDGYPAPRDPAKMAKAIVERFEAEVAPPRLALGQDLYGYIKAALNSRLDQIEAYKNLMTDCDDVQNSLKYAR